MALTGSLVFAVLSAALSSFLFGYNVGVINAPQVVVAQWIRSIRCSRLDHGNATQEDEWCRAYPDNATFADLTKHNSELSTIWSLVSSIFCLGALIGALAANFFVARFGRKGTMLLNNVTALVGSVCMLVPYYVGSYELLIVGRFIIGMNAGFNSGVPPMYLTEIAPSDLRGALGTVHQLVIVVGVFISNILGLPQLLGDAYRWPYLLAFSVVPAALQVVTLFFCPESPRHLYLNRHEPDQAKKALEFFQGSADVAYELEQMEEEHLASKDMPTVTIPELFRDRFLRKIIIICIMVMLSQQFSGINAVMFYSTSIFSSCGMHGIYALYATIGMGAIFVVATGVSMVVVEKAGRKILLLIGLGGMLVMTILLVVFMRLMDSGYEWASYLAVISVMLYIILFAIGPGPIPWFIASELFTQGPRAPAMSVVAGVNWSSALFITLTFPMIVNVAKEYTFLIFTGFLVGFVVYTYLKVPETKGKRVDEIQAEMRQSL
ncbi:solute carrier family 2, facilitated glucose transporter member 1-like [Paramacrobiotus metropolitanus]|uniref:solute carrier family 2, facilitated glucose transporter member 1-like n=1 Tax=Paramacrobiotus metropolitanus TaxID=2943436 RepID=UPI002445BD5F|nr:solute carrier family 2, facilitated glucose transporter member 1-like [Paramacrobiotus metropolitanus]